MQHERDTSPFRLARRGGRGCGADGSQRALIINELGFGLLAARAGHAFRDASARSATAEIRSLSAAEDVVGGEVHLRTELIKSRLPNIAPPSLLLAAARNAASEPG